MLVDKINSVYWGSNTSFKLTTPKTKAIIAPITAVVPICKPFGCHITKIKVTKKIKLATIILRLRTIYLYIKIY